MAIAIRMKTKERVGVFGNDWVGQRARQGVQRLLSRRQKEITPNPRLEPIMMAEMRRQLLLILLPSRLLLRLHPFPSKRRQLEHHGALPLPRQRRLRHRRDAFIKVWQLLKRRAPHQPEKTLRCP